MKHGLNDLGRGDVIHDSYDCGKYVISSIINVEGHKVFIASLTRTVVLTDVELQTPRYRFLRPTQIKDAT